MWPSAVSITPSGTAATSGKTMALAGNRVSISQHRGPMAAAHVQQHHLPLYQQKLLMQQEVQQLKDQAAWLADRCSYLEGQKQALHHDIDQLNNEYSILHEDVQTLAQLRVQLHSQVPSAREADLRRRETAVLKGEQYIKSKLQQFEAVKQRQHAAPGYISGGRTDWQKAQLRAGSFRAAAMQVYFEGKGLAQRSHVQPSAAVKISRPAVAYQKQTIAAAPAAAAAPVRLVPATINESETVTETQADSVRSSEYDSSAAYVDAEDTLSVCASDICRLASITGCSLNAYSSSSQPLSGSSDSDKLSSADACCIITAAAAAPGVPLESDKQQDLDQQASSRVTGWCRKLFSSSKGRSPAAQLKSSSSSSQRIFVRSSSSGNRRRSSWWDWGSARTSEVESSSS